MGSDQGVSRDWFDDLPMTLIGQSGFEHQSTFGREEVL